MEGDGPVAVFADVHGNRWALEAVLEDIERRGVRRVLNLGDSLYGPPDPAGTADLLCRLDPPSVRGNQDRPGALGRELAGIVADIILCGHSHVPRLVHLPDGRIVLNPGSAGLPAYTDDAPYPHAMEAGSPHARYALLERTEAGWRTEQRKLSYDAEAAAAAAERQGRGDWAAWLRSGRRRHG